MKNSLESQIIDEFSSEETQQFYIKKAQQGFRDSEKHFINKHFKKSNGKVLDLGCGMGRTTLKFFELSYDVVGVDITPSMIENAKMIANERGYDITYIVGDACSLDFKDETFDYILFSNQGWTMIPGKEKRMKALSEIYRVLKHDGVFIFTTHYRVFTFRRTFQRINNFIKVKLLKPLGLKIMEEEYGDIFFVREGGDEKSFSKKQYIHIPSLKYVLNVINKSGFKLIENSNKYQISKIDVRKYPPMVYVCKK